MVDWDGLENRCAFTGTVGSNPTLSATEFVATIRHRSVFRRVPPDLSGRSSPAPIDIREQPLNYVEQMMER